MSRRYEEAARLEELTQLFRDDRAAFAAACLEIVDKSNKRHLMRFNRAQAEVNRRADEQMHRTGRVRMLVPKARQLGVSTGINARGFHKAVMTPEGINGFVLTHRDDASDNLFSMIRRFQDGMPIEFAHDVQRGSAKELALGNGSRYRVGTARSGDVGRSFTIQFFHGSECALWANENDIMTGVLQAVPSEDGTEVWLESTGRGPAGLFFEMCRDAAQGLGEYEVVFLAWWWDDNYRRQPPVDWQPPPAWEEYQRAHKLAPDQLYWAFGKNLELIRGSDKAVAASGSPDEPCDRFRQEYPSSMADAFVASQIGKLIKSDAVQKARNAMPELQEWAPILLGVDVSRSHDRDATTLIDRQGRHAGRNIFEKMQTTNIMEIANRIVRLKTRIRIAACFIDVSGGLGAGVYDRLCELGHSSWVFPVTYSAKATAPQFANKRVEMWWDLKMWLEGPIDVSIPDSDEVAAHILAPMSLVDDGYGRQILEPKDKIRKREGFSPDWGDALAQTWAEPVMAEQDVLIHQHAIAMGGHAEPMGW